MADNFEQMTKTRCNANGLYNQLFMLETGIYTGFWNDVLKRINSTNKLLQDPTLDVNTTIYATKSLRSFVQYKCHNFVQYQKRRVDILETTDFIKHRKRQRNTRLNLIDFNELPRVDLTPSLKLKIQSSRIYTIYRYIYFLRR